MPKRTTEMAMKTAMKIIAFMAVGYILAQVWYAGFNEGWRQASDSDCSANRADSGESPHVLPFPAGSGDSYQRHL